MNPCDVILGVAILFAGGGWIVWFRQRSKPIVPVLIILIPGGMWIVVEALAC